MQGVELYGVRLCCGEAIDEVKVCKGSSYMGFGYAVVRL